MRILHYTLGLPPIRSGGLTKYAMDLMIEQSKKYEIIHLYPGKIDLINRKTRIQKKKKKEISINHFEIINSLPLPLFRGIKTPSDLMVSVSKDIYKSFLKEVNPSIIHLHTLMGIHKEFFNAIQDLGIKLVYTTHDYFGICPTINLFKDDESVVCKDFNEGRGCATCCFNSMSTKSLLLAQTPIYPSIRKFKSVLPVVKNKRNKIISPEINDDLANEYVELREFYTYMLNSVDFFHFNSALTEKVFRSYLNGIKGKVINITHANIKKVNKRKIYGDKIRIGYLGPFSKYKGFFALVESFKKLPVTQYELHLYGEDRMLNIQENIYTHGRYNINELEAILSAIDVLVVPSICKETFGFTTLEALSHCVPVIVSKNVGSKDLVKKDFGWIFADEELTGLLGKVNKELLVERHANIYKDFKVSMIEEHSKDIINEIYN